MQRRRKRYRSTACQNYFFLSSHPRGNSAHTESRPSDPAGSEDCDRGCVEWETILRFTGGDAEEIKDVQLRMGRVCR